MPTIRISDETWERLKRWAVPLEDSPDDAVRKVLDIAEQATGLINATPTTPLRKQSLVRRRRGGKLPQKEFRLPLLEELSERGGRASTQELRRVIEARVKPRLSTADYEPVSTGDPRWWNAICWERSALVKEGLLRNDSPRGIWELSEKGVRFVETRLGRAS